MQANDFLDLATRIAKAAGQILTEKYASAATGIESKSSPTDLVSDADRIAEDFIVGQIHAARANDGILAEEGSEAPSTTGIRWIVDPLDGTINYLYRIPHWTTSIAVADEEGVFVGVVWDPNRQELFTAIRGEGAFLNGTKITVSPQSDLTRSLVGTGFSYALDARGKQADIAAQLLRRVRDIRRGGASTLDLSWVACGRLDAFYESNLMPWDRAAGELILTEAGGKFAQMISQTGSDNGVLAAGPGIFGALFELLVRLGAGFERDSEVVG